MILRVASRTVTVHNALQHPGEVFSMRSLFLAALVVGTAAAPAHAEVYDNKSIPFFLQTPAGFAVRSVTAAGYEVALDIDPVGDFPDKVADETRMCIVRFKTEPSTEPQPSLNRRWTDEAVLSQARGPVGGLMDVKSEKTFALPDTTGGDVVGIEYVGPLRKNQAAVLFMSLALTPRGRLMMNCLMRDGQSERALPMLRSIRDTIRPPK
jgi:hypothetical protein